MAKEEDAERIPNKCLASSVSEDAAAATALFSQMKLEDCKHPTSSTTLILTKMDTSPKEELLIMH